MQPVHKMLGIIIQRNCCRFSNCSTKFLSNIRSSNNHSCHSQQPMEDRPVEKSITEKLTSGLNPVHLKIINESYMHNVPKGSETHFKVFIVSKEFENKSLLNCHRLVNSLLEYELKNGVHALTIETKTPSQWDPKEEVKASPKCLGGFGK